MWEIECAIYNDVDRLLGKGWEPFAVTHTTDGKENVYHFRRQKPEGAQELDRLMGIFSCTHKDHCRSVKKAIYEDRRQTLKDVGEWLHPIAYACPDDCLRRALKNRVDALTNGEMP